MNSPGKILIVEDDSDLREVLIYHLKREGFAVTATGDGGEALQIAQRQRSDVILLDLMLPGLDGWQVCRQLRANTGSGVHVIIISARDQEDDVLRGLELGADDYVRKPFSLREIVARVRTVLRRVPPGSATGEADTMLKHPPLTLSAVSHEVRLADAPLQLTATVYRLLHLLMAHPGRIFDRQQLLVQIGEQRSNASGRNIDVHIRALRRKLGLHAAMIDTARGVGYRFWPTPVHSEARPITATSVCG
jgi:two-component system phosphate regulon response regulator PhoB